MSVYVNFRQVLFFSVERWLTFGEEWLKPRRQSCGGPKAGQKRCRAPAGRHCAISAIVAQVTQCECSFGNLHPAK